MAENTAKSSDFGRAPEVARPITVRFAPETAARLEEDARNQGVSPTEVVRAIVVQHYLRKDEEPVGFKVLSAEVRALRETLDERFWQLMYEHSRNRHSLFEIALASVRDEQTLRAILEQSKKSAEQWIEQCRESERRSNGAGNA